MALEGFRLAMTALPGGVPAWHARAEPARLRELASAIAERGGRLAALWGSDERDGGAGFALHVAFVVDASLLWVEVPLDTEQPRYPDLSVTFPCADRMQRALRDLLGIEAEGAYDQRAWLRHGAWPADGYPLRRDAPAGETWPNQVEPYAFVQVEGDGVHEIPVGPVHAGIIEPGHFRFSIVGEKVLKLEERLGYVHKGIERRFTELPILEGHRLAARVSGDSAAAYSWAYCQALEGLSGVVVPARAAWLRA